MPKERAKIERNLKSTPLLIAKSFEKRANRKARTLKT